MSGIPFAFTEPLHDPIAEHKRQQIDDAVLMERARAVRFLRLLANSYERSAAVHNADGRFGPGRDAQQAADALLNASGSLAGGNHTHCKINPLNPFAWPSP